MLTFFITILDFQNDTRNTLRIPDITGFNYRYVSTETVNGRLTNT